ncbi:lysophospholipase [Maritalea mobilis]|uniref:alpha/beta hydrolase n=1 Tax=Maritalea mobilis TaxID=483324 RepID=UPI001C98C272|nr:alpha/beta fold hydrolase [Maritalea mobilis]MBY6202340.1 lysophospholipase [Maritalea mobilis]
MRDVGRWLGRFLLALVVLGAAFWFLAPREQVVRSATGSAVFEADPGLLAAREAGFDDIVPGTEARVVWAGDEGAVTRWAVLYLHGFSATSEELRPVPDRVAEALGANLVFARLPGHGRTGTAMAEARASDWVDDTDLMLDVARAVGDRVLVIGTSTGATLAAYAATERDMAVDVAGMVLISPNFRVADPAGMVLGWPLAGVWVPWITGPERGFEPVNEAQAAYWTTAYPSPVLASLGALLRELRGRDLSAVTVPALFLFSDADAVVDPRATHAAAERWGGPVTLRPVTLPDEGVDPYAHVIAGDILSPVMTDRVVEEILDFAGGVPD